MKLLPPSPLNDLHADTTRLARRGEVPPREPSVLYGTRGLYRPTMALRTIARMGPVRHALAQRAVCGTVEVHAPFADDLAAGRGPQKKKK